MKRYCLANYILTADIPEDIGFGTQTVSIGGEGSYMDTITISLTKELFTTEGDNTGSWVHIKNLDKTVNIYSNLNTEAAGMTLTLRDTLNNTICVCEDCLLTKIPDQAFASDPATQEWTFTCGKITFVDTLNN